MVSKEFKRIVRLLESIKEAENSLTVEGHRSKLDKLAAMVILEKDVKIESVDAGGVGGEWISTPESNENHILLYLHGGGYVAGSPKSHHGLASRISRAGKIKVLAINYRIAPEDPFPAALEDSVTAYSWLSNTQKIESKNILIGGDSAGGGLTLATLLKLKEMNLPLPVAAVCISPWVDLALTGDSNKNNADIDPFLTPELCIKASKWYYGDNDPKNPLISPLYGDLRGLPPILIHVGTRELVTDDSIRFAEKAKSSGVDLTLEVFEGMIHVFHAFALVIPEAREAIEKIGKFIQKFF